jgi:uncharacterized protein (TIGR02679 family)
LLTNDVLVNLVVYRGIVRFSAPLSGTFEWRSAQMRQLVTAGSSAGKRRGSGDRRAWSWCPWRAHCRQGFTETAASCFRTQSAARAAAAGVHLDELSSLVLCLGLLGDARTSLGRALASCRDAGQPTVLTLCQLRCHDEPLHATRVRMCENPVVVAVAADELGAGCQPLVCVGGHPSAAVWRLLELLASSGAQFDYHGDFDWGGVRIARGVRERVSWHPWRYDRHAYEAAALAAHPLAPLAGNPTTTPWDPELASVMRQRNVRIEEELTLDTLLQDLSC